MVDGEDAILRAGMQALHEDACESGIVLRVDHRLDVVGHASTVDFEPVGVAEGRVGEGWIGFGRVEGCDEVRIRHDDKLIAIVVAACEMLLSADGPLLAADFDAPDRIEQRDRSPFVETIITSQYAAYDSHRTPVALSEGYSATVSEESELRRTSECRTAEPRASE